MDPRGSHAPDMENPITDACARDLAALTPQWMTPDLPRDFGVRWKEATREYRDFWRVRARRFMAGDMSMLPPTPAISEGFNQPA